MSKQVNYQILFVSQFVGFTKVTTFKRHVFTCLAVQLNYIKITSVTLPRLSKVDTFQKLAVVARTNSVRLRESRLYFCGLWNVTGTFVYAQLYIFIKHKVSSFSSRTVQHILYKPVLFHAVNVNW